MSLEKSESTTSSTELIPNYELAGSLQAVLNDLKNRDFQLDIQQDEALSAIGQALVEGTKSGYVEMATSTGKTAIESLLAEATVRSGKRALILAPTLSIARQLVGVGSEKSTGLDKFAHLSDSTKVRSHFGSTRADKSANIVVSTYSGFLNDAKNGHTELGEFDVIIADECHRSLGTETSKALKKSFPGAFKLGLSATPDYATDRKSEEVYDKKLYEFSLIHAVESGKTAPVRALIYETEEILHLDQNQMEFTERELAPLINNMQRNGTALALTKSFIADGRQGVIACIPGDGNIHARRMSQLLQESGINSTDIGSHLNPSDQAERLQQFDSGEISVITFTRAIEEGWDSDKASFAINLAPTASPVRTKQLLGRVLRKKLGGEDSLYIDFIDEKEGIAKSQYTALHALDLEYIDIDRTLGRQDTRDGKPYHRTNMPLSTLSPAIIDLLLKSQGKRISDVVASKQADPLVREWNRTLEKEGLSPEPIYNHVLEPKFAAKVEKAYSKFVHENGEEPTIEELEEAIKGILIYQQNALAQYALRVPVGEVIDEPIAEDDPRADAITTVMTDYYDSAIEKLSEREKGVVRLRLGLDDDKERSYEDVSIVYGVTRERIRQIESKSLIKLRSQLYSRPDYDEQPIGEHLKLSCNFDVKRPTTYAQARIVFAFDALEEFAIRRDESGIDDMVNANDVKNAFRVEKIFLPPFIYRGSLINICDYILPVAEKLYIDAQRKQLSYKAAVLRDAVNSLTWLSGRPQDEQLVKIYDMQVSELFKPDILEWH